jgi:hypothetical protein
MYYVENTSAVLLQNYNLYFPLYFASFFLCTFRPRQGQREFLVLERTAGIIQGTVCLQNVCVVFSFFSLKTDTNWSQILPVKCHWKFLLAPTSNRLCCIWPIRSWEPPCWMDKDAGKYILLHWSILSMKFANISSCILLSVWYMYRLETDINCRYG